VEWAPVDDQVVRPLVGNKRRRTTNVLGLGGLALTIHNELSTQNWSGQGESDSLIKTKHCDGPKG
jgi:hypothetical protein